MAWLRDLRERLVPTPRRPVTWAASGPLAVFALLFGGVVGYLVLTDRVAFGRPWMLGWLTLAVWLWWLGVAGHGGLSGGRAATSIFVRLVLFGALVGALAEPRAVRTSVGITAVYVVDVSDSVGNDSLKRVMNFVVSTEAKKDPIDKAGLIAFGRNAAVELPPRNSFPYENAINVEVSGDATNLQEALQLAAAMIPEDSRGRVVLASDGTATLGNVGEMLDTLAARGIAVDTLPIEYKHDHEVWVDRLELPSAVKLGESYNVSVLVSSLEAESGVLTLLENGETIGEVPIEIESGKNRFQLPIRLREAGFYEYEARVDVAPVKNADGREESRDFIEANNVALGSIFVKGQGRVMLVVDPLDDATRYEPFQRAMAEGERLVDVVEAYDVPRDPLALMPYDAIVFCNVARDLFDRAQIEAVDRSIFDQGIGFLMVGGPNSFGAGGWRRSPIEELLPVSMDISEKKVLPKGALAIVLHTCEFAEGNTWGKRITKEAIRVLSDQDEVGVLGYNGTVDYIVPFTPAGDYESMVPSINAASIGDMPSFGPAMERGLNGLLKVKDAAVRHMIIISDGDPQPPTPALVKKFVDNKVTCSMVAIFPHGNIEISTMREIAGATGGKYYYPSDPNQLPGIFIKESKTLRRNLIQKRTVTPEIGMPSSVLRGLDALPPVDAYVLTSRRDRAENILLAMPDPDAPEEQSDIDPILAVGRYGLGSTAAFTSDLATAWSTSWVNWAEYQAFVGQLLTRVSRTESSNFLRLYTFVEGGEAVVTVEDFHPQEMFLDVQAKVSGPRGRTESVSLRQTGPRRYQTTVPLWGKGRYMINVVGVGQGRVIEINAGDGPPVGVDENGVRTERATGGWVMPYSPEYLRFQSDPITLEQVRDATGGKELEPTTSGEEIFDRREPMRSTRPVFDWWLAALALLLPLDVAVRRIQLDWATVKSWFARDAAAPEPVRTTGQLLDRTNRQRQQTAPEPKPELRKRPASPPTSGSASSTAGQAKPSDKTPPGKADGGKNNDEDPNSTAAKLLALKRRRDE